MKNCSLFQESSSWKFLIIGALNVPVVKYEYVYEYIVHLYNVQSI